MKPLCLIVILSNFLPYLNLIYAQQDSALCKVTMKEIAAVYAGECKNGLANGQGDAAGLHHYKGAFKDGLPNGNGVYYYSDNEYYAGTFQDGKKEGKGEMHFISKSKPDSIIKGYWSGDEYRGDKYITYSFSTTETFDQIDITPGKVSGNTVTIEISTTTGIPSGAPGFLSGSVLLLNDIISPTGSLLTVRSKVDSGLKSSVTLEMVGFPCKLFGTLSDGQTFSLDLYKSANWKIRLYKNR